MNNKQKALKISLIALLCTLLISLIVYALIEINNTNIRKVLEEELKNALKANSPEYVTKPIEEYNITIFKQDGKYIWGGISEKSIDELKNKNTQPDDFNGFVGASFYAYKAEDGWKTIYAGQDSPLCSDVEKYNFPKDIYQYCNDQQIEQVVDDLSVYSIKCLPVNPQSLATKTQITYKGNEIFNFTSENEFYEGYIIGKIENNLYFVNQVGGLGGFMLYGNLGFIYKLNLDTFKLENIYKGDYIYNKDFIFYGDEKEFNVLYFKTGITKKFTNIDLDGYQHGTYYISPKGENIAIPFSSVDPDGIGVGGIMLLNLNTGEVKEIYREKNSVPHISGWKNEDTPNMVVETNYDSSNGKNIKETDFFYYDKTLPSVVLTKETESIEDYFTKKIEPFDYSWIENMAECRATTFPENEKAITDENKRTEWTNFYNNLLKKFDKNDVVTTYTFTATEDGSKDEFSLYVLPNKLGYKTADDFEKDFSYDCGIGDGTFYTSENYLLETFGCGGVDDGHKIQCSDMRDMVESSIKLK